MLGIKFKRAKGSKYKNRFVRIDGHLFHSQKEAKWWLFLKEREERGEITCLRKQVRYEIYRNKDGKPRHYIADFVFEEEGKERVVDVKSSFTAKDPVFKIKKELFECKYMKNLEIWTTSAPNSRGMLLTGLSDSTEPLLKTQTLSEPSKSKPSRKPKKTSQS
jgi:hypothetical protein